MGGKLGQGVGALKRGAGWNPLTNYGQSLSSSGNLGIFTYIVRYFYNLIIRQTFDFSLGIFINFTDQKVFILRITSVFKRQV